MKHLSVPEACGIVPPQRGSRARLVERPTLVGILTGYSSTVEAR